VDLRSGSAYWPIKDGLIRTYPALEDDTRCDVAVIGGGISGALAAYHLVDAGLDTVLIDRRDVGGGSTSASTGLLQYEIDTNLIDLIDRIGKDGAQRSYRLCLDAITTLGELAERTDTECEFAPKKSLYLASSKKDVAGIRREYEARKAMGIAVTYLEPGEIGKRFSFEAPGAILSDVAAEVNPYRLTMGLLAAASRAGLRAFDRTTVTGYEHRPRGVTLTTDRGATIRARHVVMATGYEAQQHLRQKIVTYANTYAAITEPVDQFTGWGEEQCLIWETARPYFYARTTSDRRIMFGGADQPYESDEKRDARIGRKTAQLTRRLSAFFPDIKVETAYAWAGVFGGTQDGLPVIGTTPEYPRAYFALGYGGNGITFSLVAAEIIRDALTRKKNPDAELFGFERLRRNS
jgi:glycine/D-amino acid oxidase-like deaminating enzyme